MEGARYGEEINRTPLEHAFPKHGVSHCVCEGMEQVPVLLAISHLVIIRNEVIDFTARYSVIIKLMLLLLKDGGRRLIRS